MRDPFLIEGPAVLHFSGGRTSGYMLRRVLDAHKGKLPFDVKAIFTNTGKENEATLSFVRECSERWGVEIIWLEWTPAAKQKDRWKQVDFASASRNGEPFEALIKFKRYIPNVAHRLCTEYLKVGTVRNYCRGVLKWRAWDSLLGFRADEPRRVASARAPKRRACWTNVCPLAEAKVNKPEILEFWKKSNFDLRLPVAPDGSTIGGNCDLCFLKGVPHLVGLVKAQPASVQWWKRQEREQGHPFRAEGPSYEMIERLAAAPGLVPDFYSSEPVGDCFCAPDEN